MRFILALGILAGYIALVVRAFSVHRLFGLMLLLLGLGGRRQS